MAENRMALNSDELDKAKILVTLSTIPPITQLFPDASDQRREVWRVKRDYLYLGEETALFFSGQPSQLNSKPLSEYEKRSIGFEKIYWLAFYQMVQESWHEIAKSCKQEGNDLSTVNVNAPGELLALIFSLQSKEKVKSLSGYLRWSPSNSRKEFKLCRDVVKLLGSKNYEDLTHLARQKVNKAIALSDTLRKKSDSGRLVIGIRQVCRSIAKDSERGSPIEINLRAYEAASADLYALVNRELHPRQQRKGFEMVDGKISPMAKYGGVASA